MSPWTWRDPLWDWEWGWHGRCSPFLPILAVTDLAERSGDIPKFRVRQNALSKMESISTAMKGQGKPQRSLVEGDYHPSQGILHLLFSLPGPTLLPFILRVVMNSEGPDILPCLPAIKLACHSFLDAGRRHDIPGSETNDFIIHNNICSQSISIFLCWFVSPNSHKKIQRGPGEWHTAHAVGCLRGTLRLGNLNHLKWAVSMAVLSSRGRHYVYYTGQ